MANVPLPETIEINGKKVGIYDFMLTPCETKDDLHNWIKIFLGLDMPDCIVCEESTSSPMEMIWNVYRAAKDGDVTESSQLYFASRDSFKTLSAAVAELLMLLHFRRTCSHMGAIKQQAKKCYDYLKGFLRQPVLNRVEQLRDTMERTELNLTSPWNMNPYMQIIVCTLAGANSEHTHLLTVDEVDVVDNAQAYQEAKKIPTETPDKKPSITLYISTRKSPFGLVQYEVDRAHETGLKVRSWNIVDVAQPCPPEKNRMAEGKVPQYFKESMLTVISPAEYEQLPPVSQADWVKKEDMYPGCVGCPIAPLCLGRLATKQMSRSHLLKSHHDLEKKFRESELSDAIAQLMCLKPSTHGLVFTSFDHLKSVASPTRMWEIFMGQKANHIISKEELIATFHERGVPAYAGIDWGWTSPSVCIVAFIDRKENIYIVEELSMTQTDDPEFVDIVARRVQPVYKVQAYFPDIENPSGISLLKKANLPVSTKVDKSIHAGIQTIKRYMKVPGLNITKFFILEGLSGTLEELGKYHLKLDAAGKVLGYDEYAEEFDHRIDSIRYIVHSKLGRMRAITDELLTPRGDTNPLTTQEGNFTRVPTAEELARHVGVGEFRDNREDIKKDAEKKEDEFDPNKSGGDGTNFSWSFGFLLGFSLWSVKVIMCVSGMFQKILS